MNIENVTKSSTIKAWWKCSKCNSSYYKKILRVIKNKEPCPYCTGYKVLKGFNDMWTTNPELAKSLANEEDGHEYTQFSNKKVNWMCNHCNNIFECSIKDANIQGLSCRNCSRGISYPERFIHNILSQLSVVFSKSYSPEWANGKMYDFYIPSLNCIIECHGMQHFNGGFKYIGGKNLEEEQENDRYKRELALNNNIKHYIELDCRYSRFEYIKSKLLNSELLSLLDLSIVDWDSVAINSSTSTFVTVNELWNSGIKCTETISKEMGISVVNIRKYLNRGRKLNINDYGRDYYNKKYRKPILQFDTFGNLIKEWESITKASKELGIHYNGISACCNKRSKTSYGFIWRFKTDIKEDVLIDD